jgi:hypothetical protein
MALCVLSLLPIPDKLCVPFGILLTVLSFWLVVFILLVYSSIVASVHLYYAERVQFNRDYCSKLRIRACSPGIPKDLVRWKDCIYADKLQLRFAFIMTGNFVNFALTIYYAISEIANDETQDFPTCVL